MEENFFKTRRLELPGVRGEVATQREIGDALGYAGQTVAQWELEQTLPPIGRADELAVVYKTTSARIVKEIAAQAKRMNERKTVAAH